MLCLQQICSNNIFLNFFIMEIQEIKSRLPLSQVLDYYHLHPDRNNRLHCPFHDDKTPSMQVYQKTNTCYCFSSNCKTHGKSLDVIDFIMHMESSSKHEAILKARAMINPADSTPVSRSPAQTESINTAILSKIFHYFRNGFLVRRNNKARVYLESRGLDIVKFQNLGLVFGYNSAQFHHRGRISPEDMQACQTAGLLVKSPQQSRFGDGYSPWASHCAIFPLTDEKGNITGMYGRSTANNPRNKHYYLKNSKGLFYYPKKDAARLIITESIIDFLSLYQIDEIRNQYDFLPIYGTNRLNQDHKTAIANLARLQEIIFFLDGDKAGEEAIKKYSGQLSKENPQAAISKVETPDNEDINSLLQGHESEIFIHLLKTRKLLLSSIEKASNEEKKVSELSNEASPSAPPSQHQKKSLDTENPHNIRYTGSVADYYIKGGLRGNLDSMKVSLQVVSHESRNDHRAKADLYEHKPVEALVKAASERLSLPAAALKKDLSILTRLLEQHRNKTLAEQHRYKRKPPKKIPQSTINQCLDILTSAHPVERINELIGRSGVVGEQTARIFLFAIASSYKMPDTLHALIQGSSGSGKTMLLKTIYDLMPGEDTTKFTRVTDSSFYNYPEHYFVQRLVCFEDIDGLKEDALYAVRELISNEILVSSTSVKTEHGEITGAEKTVRGPIASISCTTKGEIYEDNMSRVFLIAVDESPEQTKRIIQYQQQKASGMISGQQEKQSKELLQNCVRLLKPYQVVNPYAGQIQLPEEAHKIRRLNDLYLSFVRQVTLINQYKRKKDKQGRLITEKEDLQTANAIMFDSIVLKVDELDGSLRGFYEKLKRYVQEKGKGYAFSQREIRQAFRVSKTGCQNYINTLLELEYIQKTYVGHRNTFHYKISHWDSLEALRERIKTYLDDQLKTISDQNPVVAKMVGQHAEMQELTDSNHRPREI